jgi:hypothetical protein
MNARAFSLLVCTVELSEVRLFLRRSHVGNGGFVWTRSENAVDRDCPSADSLWKMTPPGSQAPALHLVALAQDQIDVLWSMDPKRRFYQNSAEAASLSCQEFLPTFYA